MISSEIIKIDPLNLEIEMKKIEACADKLLSGGLVAFPTETVYGLGANLLDKKAIDRLYAVKKRPKDKPFTVHIAKKEDIERFAVDIPSIAYKFVDKFWPGPLTIILNSKDNKSVGLRMPNNVIAIALLNATQVPVVAPSANLFGEKPSKNAKEVLKSLDGFVDIVLDGGQVELGVESTIVDCRQDVYRVIREGAVKKDEIDKIAKTKFVLFVCTGNSCRSVMAEGLFKKIMKERLDIDVSSAGTSALFGFVPSRETVELLSEEGIDFSAHLSMPLTDEMIKKSDLILAMGNRHIDSILERAPEAKNKTYLLKEFAKLDHSQDLDIADPIGRSMQIYHDIFYTIKNALERIEDLV